MHVNTGEGVKKNDINARLCLCAVPGGQDPIGVGHEREPHQGGRGGRGAAEGRRVPVEAQAQIFVGTAANRRLAGERESERERERERSSWGAGNRRDICCVHITYTHTHARTHEKEDTSCNIARPPAVTAGERGLPRPTSPLPDQ